MLTWWSAKTAYDTPGCKHRGRQTKQAMFSPSGQRSSGKKMSCMRFLLWKQYVLNFSLKHHFECKYEKDLMTPRFRLQRATRAFRSVLLNMGSNSQAFLNKDTISWPGLKTRLCLLWLLRGAILKWQIIYTTVALTNALVLSVAVDWKWWHQSLWDTEQLQAHRLVCPVYIWLTGGLPQHMVLCCEREWGLSFSSRSFWCSGIWSDAKSQRTRGKQPLSSSIRAWIERNRVEGE